MVNGGYVKIYRSMLKSSIWNNHDISRVWLWCLLKASHNSYKQTVGHQEIELQPGQFITGRKAGAAETGFSESSFWRYLKTLCSIKNVDIKTNNKFSLVTVIKWGFYQIDEEILDSNLDNKWTTNGQQMDNKWTQPRI